ncbi:DNA translocase FtsK [Desulfoplanes formicivorans]|uniref:DNA translocase n=1 Tax=Desulfoplanes formicivorans TaxID=1592317 RepID=A0A194AGH1_9BACT|nr:DNA translocase FtsK [Desulfoplanes formicivorans]GAU08181.1 DNA translocase [Desulfoplanes formicivorans]
MTEPHTRLQREFSSLALLFAAMFLGLSLFTFSPSDPGFNHQAGHTMPIANQAGLVGAYTAGILVDFFGLGALVWPFVFLGWGASLLFPKLRPSWWRMLGATLTFILCLAWLSFPWAQEHLRFLGMQGGGFLGNTLFSLCNTYLKHYGTILVLVFCSVISVQIVFGLSWTSMGHRLRVKCLDVWYTLQTRRAATTRPADQRGRKGRTSPNKPSRTQETAPVEDQEPTPAPKPTPTRPSRSPAKTANSALPGLELLNPVPDSQPRIPKSQLEDLARRLKECLADFSIQGEVQRIQPGPVITMLEFKPAPGVKISRISGLGNDLSLALKAMAVRIVAPLPGKDTVGIEIPNRERQTVYLQEILSSPTFTKTKAKIPLALGKDIQGQPRQADLATMPHLLVAGATGAGKSVCLNTLILSILYKSGPEDVKLLLVDPKRIELAVYAPLPHLVHPVVTDMSLAKSALEWAVYEMEQRYEAMAKVGVRNIASYNQKLQGMGNVRPEKLQGLNPYPYLVIIVDELADLMLTAGKEVEVSIVRLAQLARAAGIHLILATQRPSVDVVTGLIKANFPSRIAFQVSSKHDSRTILDGVGAEYLLGRGDMLFKKSGGNLTRIHGAFVDDDEIAAVVDFWAAKGKQEFELDFASWKQEQSASAGPGGSGNDIADDPKYGEAVAFVMDHGKASISLIQRRLRIGFNKAARFIEQMEQDGIIGPQEGSKPRSVIKK